jgi:hypothetical protein
MSPAAGGRGAGSASADGAAAVGPPRDPTGAAHPRRAGGGRVGASGAGGGVAGAAGGAAGGAGLCGSGRLPAGTARRAGLVGETDSGRAWGWPPVAGGGDEPARVATLTVRPAARLLGGRWAAEVLAAAGWGWDLGAPQTAPFRVLGMGLWHASADVSPLGIPSLTPCGCDAAEWQVIDG